MIPAGTRGVATDIPGVARIVATSANNRAVVRASVRRRVGAPHAPPNPSQIDEEEMDPPQLPHFSYVAPLFSKGTPSLSPPALPPSVHFEGGLLLPTYPLIR